MHTLLRVLVTLPGILFVVMGLRWATEPAGAAASMGMPLLDGIGLSSQVGDVGGLFLSMGLMVLLAVVTQKRSWFYAPAIMLVSVALLRILAWLFHDAALAAQSLVVEFVVASLLVFAASRLSKAS